MANVSSQLRSARERAGLTLEDLASRTKIKLLQLQAIERGEFERLPGEFFTRAFLRNYAREVGLPPEDVVREYEADRQPAIAGSAALRPSASGFAATSHRITEAGPLDAAEPYRRALPLPSPRSAWPVLAAALVLILIISVVNREPKESAEPGAVPSTGAAQPESPPAATSGQTEETPEILSMEIEPSALIWINATADGERAVYRLVQPGERVTIEGRNSLRFRIGNAAAFQYALNGAPGRVLGESGEVVEFEVTPENYRTFLQ